MSERYFPLPAVAVLPYMNEVVAAAISYGRRCLGLESETINVQWYGPASSWPWIGAPKGAGFTKAAPIHGQHWVAPDGVHHLDLVFEGPRARDDLARTVLHELAHARQAIRRGAAGRNPCEDSWRENDALVKSNQLVAQATFMGRAPWR